MTSITGRGVVLLILLGSGLWGGSGASTAATPKYDGTWSVSVITEDGTCDRGYRYRIQIADGKLQYQDPNGPAITISGQVDPTGHVNVSVRRGDQHADGTGRLSTDSGAGQWRGGSGSQQCSGRWEAERRG
jgi:hypothetical protein